MAAINRLFEYEQNPKSNRFFPERYSLTIQGFMKIAREILFMTRETDKHHPRQT